MSERIAVGSSDGEWIDQHFGNCSQFYVYDVTDEGQWEFVELRVNEVSGITGLHQESQLQRTVAHLADCTKVLVSRIGPGPHEMLKERGVEAYTQFISLKHAQGKLGQCG
ncbi:MAG: hypothetical protein K0R57_5153 [Paenibacillaceae bacterium]|jgi:predicted Fe-Mo cluster-binding NifX family protein|nr:hypothetical protein [Paenibacillaceae bacterium]